jgi:hypothetical protein
MVELLRAQNGLISRRQILAAGGDDQLIARLVRRRELTRVYRAVYVDHTGPLSWEQRAWAALLYYWPAALSGASALRAHGVRTTGSGRARRTRATDRADALAPDAPVEIAIDGTRHVRAIPGVRVRRVERLAAFVQPNLTPPRFRLEHALLDVAARAGRDDDAVAVLADSCQCGRTTARRLHSALQVRSRLRRRRFLLEVLADVAEGAYSVPERRYLRRVERAHGLPRGHRQLRASLTAGAAYRDVHYRRFRMVVELDGRLGHDEVADEWDDLDRDIDGALDEQLTIRAGWRHVLDACRLASAVARLLRARGWTGSPAACSPGCTVLRDWNTQSAGQPAAFRSGSGA